jgi:hypothetical protein
MRSLEDTMDIAALAQAGASCAWELVKNYAELNAMVLAFGLEPRL